MNFKYEPSLDIGTREMEQYASDLGLVLFADGVYKYPEHVDIASDYACSSKVPHHHSKLSDRIATPHMFMDGLITRNTLIWRGAIGNSALELLTVEAKGLGWPCKDGSR